MKTILLTRYTIGQNILNYFVNNYRNDLVAVITEKNDHVFHLAKEYGIPAYIWEGSQKTHDVLKKDGMHADIGFMVWWAHILKEPLLYFPTHGFINTHPSLIPHARGSLSNVFTLLENAPFGVTLHYANKTVDGGRIIAQKEISYGWEDTDETLYNKSVQGLEELISETYPLLRKSMPPGIPQPQGEGSFHRTNELDSVLPLMLDKKYTLREILNTLRARSYSKHEGCWFKDNGEKYEVRVSIKKIRTDL